MKKYMCLLLLLLASTIYGCKMKDKTEYDEFDAMDADEYREKEKEAANPIPVFMDKGELEKLLFSGLNAELESTRKFYKDLLDLWCSDK